MSSNTQYSNITVFDDNFYILDNTLNAGVSFQVASSDIIKLTLPTTSGTIPLNESIQVNADNILPGDSSVYITTTSGGLSLNTSQGSSLIFNYDGTPEISLGLSTMKLKDNQAYTILHNADGASENLLIKQTGSVDASLILQSEGTGNDAIFLNTTAGSIDINTSSGKAVNLQNNSQIYNINTTLSGSLDQQQIWTTSNITSNLGTSGSIFIKAYISAIGTSGYSAAYEANNVFYWDTVTLSARGGVSGDVISRGDTTNKIGDISDVAVNVSGTDPQIQFTPYGINDINFSGIVIATVAIF